MFISIYNKVAVLHYISGNRSKCDKLIKVMKSHHPFEGSYVGNGRRRRR